MPLWSRLLQLVLGSLLVVAALFVLSLLTTGQRSLTELETIQSIPYPKLNSAWQITERLAHTDLELREPVLAKNVVLSFRYRPHNAQELAVGVRENSFWLSYPRTTFYIATDATDTDWRTATVTIPLSDKIQDTDRSIDVMFMADAGSDLVQAVQKTTDNTQWEIADLKAHVTYAWPTMPQLKDYIRSVMDKERPL